MLTFKVLTYLIQWTETLKVEELCYLLQRTFRQTNFYRKLSNRGFFVEINLGKIKWLLNCFYNPKRENRENQSP